MGNTFVGYVEHLRVHPIRGQVKICRVSMHANMFQKFLVILVVNTKKVKTIKTMLERCFSDICTSLPGNLYMQ